MPYYQIKTVQSSDEKDTYYIYQGNKEKDIQLNWGYSTARSILEGLYQLTTEEDPISLYIYYHNEEIKYFLKNNQRDLLDKLKAFVPQCGWESAVSEIDSSFAKEKVTLRGAASPIVLDNREENLLDELIRMLPRTPFLIQVKAEKKNEKEAREEIQKLEEHINKLSQNASVQVGEQGHLGENIKRMVFGGENLSYQLKNITAQKQLDMLENHLYTLNTQGFIFKSLEYNIYAPEGIAELIATKMETFSRRSGSLNLHFLRREPKEYSFEYLNYISSNYAASILALPMKKTPGIAQQKHLEFGVESGGFEEDTIRIGNLMKHYETGLGVEIPLKDLTKHAFVTGVTGSGKTSTIKNILLKSYEQKVPFLILEPAKTEYQYLKHSVPSLRRYTLGLEGENGFKINPFYCPSNIHIQTHLDLLKSVFIAAFPMYGPMPYILETAIYNIYGRAGWDFISGKNVYEHKLKREELFPTLEDLYEEIDEATKTVGYSEDLSNDIRGALKVRIGSLLSGAKGRMLNTCEGNSISELLQYPAVMELESIGDDQEKVFLMGLLLIAIYEEYISKGNHSKNLKHLLVIEEAHRLLENVKESSNMETSDMKGKAISTFNNILSEIRTYGQGLIIADQIPAKLSPDIIKNTNLKLIHKLYAKDDRSLVGESIGLTEEHIDDLVRLQEGEAVFFHGRLQDALKVKIKVDLKLLAQHQLTTRKETSSKLEISNLLLQQTSAKEKLFKGVNTIILYPEKKEEFIISVRDYVLSNYGFALAREDEQKLLKGIVKSYWKSKQKGNQKNFLDYKQMLHELEQTIDPLSTLIEWFNDNQEPVNHPMLSFSSIYSLYENWRNQLNITSYGQLLRGGIGNYQDRSYLNYLKNQDNIKNYFETNLLKPIELNELIHALMLYEYKEDLPTLEKYFGIKDLNPMVKL